MSYGPLSFSLAIKERYVQYGNHDPNWPEWEVFPDSPWNYGLVLNASPSNTVYADTTVTFSVVAAGTPPFQYQWQRVGSNIDPGSSFKLIQTDGPLAPQPFTPETTPIKLEATGRRIPNWRADGNNVVGKLQPSPVKSDQPDERITLIPMGAARLRLSMFPVIGSGPNAHEWAASAFKASASHCFEGDTLEALQDGLQPANSNDHDIPRFTWWDHRGTREWVQLDFPQAKQVSSVKVYWFDDTGQGECRLPASWRLLYRDGNDWKEIASPPEAPVIADKWNALSFRPITARALRIEANLRPGFSGGLLGWKVN